METKNRMPEWVSVQSIFSERKPKTGRPTCAELVEAMGVRQHSARFTSSKCWVGPDEALYNEAGANASWQTSGLLIFIFSKMSKLSIEEYIQKQSSPQREICTKLQEIIIKTFPDIQSEMKWGVPVYGDEEFYIVALKDHVNLGFSLKKLKEEDYKYFSGGGKTMKHLEISSLDDINVNEICKLLKMVRQIPKKTNLE